MASKLLGAQVKRKEDPRLITGTSQYVADIALPGLAHVAFVRSPHAHARIRGIDGSAALRRPGVVAVITGRDLMPHCAPLPIATVSAEGGGESTSEVGRQHHPLSVDRVRHVGEAVAAVIGTSVEAAADGAAEVQVDWDVLPAVADPAAAMADGAPLLFDDAPKNIEHTQTIKAGDPDAAFAKAHRVVKQRMNSQRLSGVPLEPRAVLAAPDPASGGLVVWSTHQAPHALRTGLGQALRMPENQIRVIAPEVGGGFGVKFGTYPEDVVVAVLSRLRRDSAPLGRDARRAHDVHDPRAGAHDRHGGGRRRGRTHHGAAHARGGGRRRLPDLHVHPGPHADDGRRRLSRRERRATQHVRVHQHDVGRRVSRAPGRPEAAYYLERLVDCVAAELGRPPEEIRRKNFIPPDAFPYAAPTGQNYDSGEYDRALTRALQVARCDALRAEQRERLDKKDRRLLGIGMACYVEMCGFGPFESAIVRVEPSGTVSAMTGTSPHGQGHETTFAQIIADQLGVEFDQITVRHGDTSITPMGFGTGGSRSLAVGGSAMFQAAGKVQEKARRIAASMLEAAFEDVELRDGHYQVKGSPARSLTLAKIAERAYGEALGAGARARARGHRLLPSSAARLPLRRPRCRRGDRPRDGATDAARVRRRR